MTPVPLTRARRANGATSVASVVELKHLRKTFSQAGADVVVLSDVSLSIGEGEVLGIVGESGCGKSTLAKLLVGLHEPDHGSSMSFAGRPLAGKLKHRDRAAVKGLQLVFQDPGESLNPDHTVRRILDRVLALFTRLDAKERRSHVRDIAQATRFPVSDLERRPRQLSGGLKQRVAIARAFLPEPRVVVCDEVTSALDASVQAVVLNMLLEHQRKANLSYVFISHDLGVVQYVSDRIAIMYLGDVVEVGTTESVLAGPCHPYTEALFDAAPTPGGPRRERIRLSGDLPSHAARPRGCPFHTRCPRKLGTMCETEPPPVREVGAGHTLTCHIPVDVLAGLQSRDA